MTGPPPQQTESPIARSSNFEVEIPKNEKNWFYAKEISLCFLLILGGCLIAFAGLVGAVMGDAPDHMTAQQLANNTRDRLTQVCTFGALGIVFILWAVVRLTKLEERLLRKYARSKIKQ